MWRARYDKRHKIVRDEEWSWARTIHKNAKRSQNDIKGQKLGSKDNGQLLWRQNKFTEDEVAAMSKHDTTNKKRNDDNRRQQ